MGGKSGKEARPTVLEIIGRGSLSDFLGDAVVYRSLVPIDRRLPSLEQLRKPLGLPASGIPRKVEQAYGRVVAEMLREANRLMTGSGDPTSVVMIGDTEHNDGGAFRNICDALGCPGGAFICDEDSNPPRLEVSAGDPRRHLYLANRWRLIDRFEDELADSGIEICRGTAVIIDIDKTALGARGRNHLPIDAARVAAVLKTVTEVPGNEVDKEIVMAVYHHFNEPRFHRFTTDNQDYLAYLALVVGSGWMTLESLDEKITAGDIASFEDLLGLVSAATDSLPQVFRSIHHDVEAAFGAGDPTPFKRFRLAEFQETVRRMIPADDSPEVGALLETKITITDEVRKAALDWRDRGALLFGLSDKPDEASFPSAELSTEGFLPLHRTPAFVVGEATGPNR